MTKSSSPSGVPVQQPRPEARPAPAAAPPVVKAGAGNLPTQERLRELFLYDPDTGIFTRLITVSSTAKAGAIAGTIQKCGYIYIGVDGRSYKAHRLAWIYMTGACPVIVDHANGDGLSNEWVNLRPATVTENCANARRRVDNTTGAKGVRQTNGRWQVRIGRGGRIHVGTYDTLEEAAAAYEVAAKVTYGAFARVA